MIRSWRQGLVLTWVTCPTWVTSVARGTGTSGSMQACSADGIDTAALNPAGVNAGAGVTLLVDSAVVMGDTLRSGLNCGKDKRIIMRKFMSLYGNLYKSMPGGQSFKHGKLITNKPAK